MLKSILKLSILSLLVVPLGASAFSMEYAPSVEIEETRIFEDNLYILGGDVNFHNTLNDDLVLFAGESVISGAVFGDLQSISGETILNGEIFGDARLYGAEVKINGNTNKDLVIVAGRTSIEEGAILNGDSLIISGEVYLGGQVLDSLKIVAGKVYIDAQILGDVEITSQNVVFGPNADVSGKITYFAPESADIESGAVIKNQPIHNQINAIGETDLIKKTILNFITFWAIVKFLSTLFTAFILVFVFRMFSQRVAQLSVEKFGKSLVVGLLSVLVIPVSIIVLFTSLFAIPISGLLFFFFISLFILATPVSGIIIGHLIRKWISKEKRPQVDFNATALGIVVLTFIYFIPVVGDILKAILILLAFGAMMLYYFEIITIKKRP